MLRHGEREGRGDVQHEVAAGDRLRPAGVALEIGGGERQPVVASGPGPLQERPHLRLPREIAEGRANLMTGG